MSQSVLSCLLCEGPVNPRVPLGASDLVAYQEHGRRDHHLSQADLAQTLRTTVPSDVSLVYVWTLPDGRPWLRAERLQGLVQAGLAAGYAPADLAAALAISTDILAKLEAGAIAGETLPAVLLAQLAEVLQVEPALVAAYLERPLADSPFRCGPGARLPLEKESFHTAIRESPRLSPAQKQAWLALVEAERQP